MYYNLVVHNPPTQTLVTEGGDEGVSVWIRFDVTTAADPEPRPQMWGWCLRGQEPLCWSSPWFSGQRRQPARPGPYPDWPSAGGSEGPERPSPSAPDPQCLYVSLRFSKGAEEQMGLVCLRLWLVFVW